MTAAAKAVWGAAAPAAAALALLLAPAPALAQTAAAPAPPTAAPPLSDMRVDPLQPDFNLAALPVTLRLPAHKMSFRVTHRFTRSLGAGDVGDLLSNFFGFDSGALIGLELRYGIMPGTQAGIRRTSDRTIELFGQQSLWRQDPSHPIALDAIATFEGTNNLRAQKSSALGALVSRTIAGAAALYVEPIFVVNSNGILGSICPDAPSPDPACATVSGENNTFMIGLGTRVRVGRTTYVVAEITPRLAGYDPSVDQMSFGLEKRVGGHTFQINFSNGTGTTLGQLARGGDTNRSWFIGFNIARKFF